MAETDPRDTPHYTATAYWLLYKEWVTQDELDIMETYPMTEDSVVEPNKLYRWDATRAVMRTDDYKYKFFMLKEEYDGKTETLHADWVARVGQEHVG